MKKNKKILVVDDTPLQAIMLRRALSQGDYDVATAKSAMEALEFLKKQRDFDLVVTDVNMPEMNGFQLCRAIKINPEYSDIAVIICTVLSDPEDLIKGIEAGADNYITRPWNDERLLKLTEEALKTRPPQRISQTEEVSFSGRNYKISTSRQYILNFLLSTYENIHLQNVELNELREELQKAYSQLKNAQREQEQIVLNIFPERVAQELIAYGSVNPMRYEDVTVGFVDFIGFTESSFKLNPQQLVEALEYYFENFDRIIETRDLERIKTIGDGYMFAGGIPQPQPNDTHTFQCIVAAMDIRSFVKESSEHMMKKYGIEWKVRIGIHTGPVVAGVIGKKRLAYDIWGETVNLANRLEAQCEENQINISSATYQKVKDYFACRSRGTLPIKSRGGREELSMEMYYVESMKA